MNDAQFQNGPLLWDNLIRTVSSVFNTPCIVAGGCLRDYKLGIEPKDIDLFIPVQRELELEWKIPELKKHNMFMDVLMPMTSERAVGKDSDYFLDVEETSDGRFEPEVRGVLDGTFGPLSVQIIARPMEPFTGEAVVSRFDFDYLQAWYDGDIHYLPVCTEAIEKRVATLIRHETQEREKKSKERFDKFAKRSPVQFKFVNPAEEARREAKGKEEARLKEAIKKYKDVINASNPYINLSPNGWASRVWKLEI